MEKNNKENLNEQVLEWFNHFVDYVGNVDSNLYNEACEYADKKENNEREYPFNEGDDYYTIEDGEVIWSCWDDISEELHNDNPNKQYFKTKKEAENYNKNN